MCQQPHREEGPVWIILLPKVTPPLRSGFWAAEAFRQDWHDLQDWKRAYPDSCLYLVNPV